VASDREDGQREVIDKERREFLIEVAWLHHEYGLTQEIIAARFGKSRSTISRALSEVEALGIVQVVVTEPMPSQARLAEALSASYGVTAHVGIRMGGEEGRLAVARPAARLIERIASLGHVSIAASWGRTLAQAAHEVRPRRTTGVTIVDAIGHTSGGQMAPAIDVTRTLARALGAAAVHLPSPAFADSASMLEFLLASRPVENALDLARSADAILVSVGVVGEGSLLRQEGLFSESAMRAVIEGGAVGEILGCYYDADGRTVAGPSLMPVGLSLDDLRAARRVVAVAAGADKAESMHAALVGGIVDELVADDELAQALLDGPAAPPRSTLGNGAGGSR
jgi:deoxyribonucleoside regulator